MTTTKVRHYAAAPQDREHAAGQKPPVYSEREPAMAQSLVVSGLAAKQREHAGLVEHKR